MKVFNTFFKITKKNIGTIIMYIAISVFITTVTAQQSPNNDYESFEDTSINLAVIDRDHSTTSQGIQSYLGSTNRLVELKDDMEVFQDELFYRNIYLIIIIPENFEADLIAGKEVTVQSIEVPGAYSSIYVGIQLEQYLNTLKNYLTLDIDPTTALLKTSELMSQQVDVTLQTKETAVTEVKDYYRFYNFMPYAIIAIMTSILGTVLLVFNQEDLRRRTICSAVSLKSRNTQLALGCCILAVGILSVLTIIPIVIYGTECFTDPNFIYLILNSVAMMLVATAVGFFVGTISKKTEHIGIWSTGLSLGLNFLGGIFVPLSYMPEKVINISKFIPTYWYSTTSTILSGNSIIKGDNLKDVLFGILIQCAFAIVIFGITLIVSRQKSQHT